MIVTVMIIFADMDIMFCMILKIRFAEILSADLLFDFKRILQKSFTYHWIFQS